MEMTEPKADYEARGAALITLLEDAHRLLCEGVQRQWKGKPAHRLSIPCRLTDTDMVISSAIGAAEAEIKRLYDLLEGECIRSGMTPAVTCNSDGEAKQVEYWEGELSP